MHRAESILSAIQTILTGLGTTGNSVERDQVYPPQTPPALSISQGEESPLGGVTNIQFQDAALAVEVTIYVKAANYNSQLNQIKAEVYAALMATRNLNLAYVIDTIWSGDTAPEASGDAEQKTMRATMRFTVAYRHSITSKEA